MHCLLLRIFELFAFLFYERVFKSAYVDHGILKTRVEAHTFQILHQILSDEGMRVNFIVGKVCHLRGVQLRELLKSHCHVVDEDRDVGVVLTSDTG